MASVSCREWFGTCQHWTMTGSVSWLATEARSVAPSVVRPNAMEDRRRLLIAIPQTSLAVAGEGLYKIRTIWRVGKDCGNPQSWDQSLSRLPATAATMPRDGMHENGFALLKRSADRDDVSKLTFSNPWIWYNVSCVYIWTAIGFAVNQQKEHTHFRYKGCKWRPQFWKSKSLSARVPSEAATHLLTRKCPAPLRQEPLSLAPLSLLHHLLAFSGRQEARPSVPPPKSRELTTMVQLQANRVPAQPAARMELCLETWTLTSSTFGEFSLRFASAHSSVLRPNGALLGDARFCCSAVAKIPPVPWMPGCFELALDCGKWAAKICTIDFYPQLKLCFAFLSGESAILHCCASPCAAWHARASNWRTVQP